jgi:HAD superfamily hydrolase (TIGR01509 family)
VRLASWLPGAIVCPEVPGYPEAQVEVIAALPVRQELSLADGDRVWVEISRPLPVRAVIFDVDGTLVDSLTAFRIVAERAAARHGLAISERAVRRALNTNQPFWDLVLPAEEPNRLEVIHRLKEQASRDWPDVLRRHGRVVPGLHVTLQTLRSRGARLGIMTGSHGGSLEPLRQDSLLDFFESIVTGQDVERPKPDPQGLLKCAAVLGVESDEAVYVGDTPLDVLAGKAAGMFSVAVLSGAGDSALLSASGPDRIIGSHARLLEVLDLT